MNTPEFHDLRWGTPMPIHLLTADGPVRVVAFGEFGFAVDDRQQLIQQLGQDPGELPGAISRQLAQVLIGHLQNTLAEQPPTRSVAQLAALSDEIAFAVRAQAMSDFARLGLRLLAFRIIQIGQR